MLYNPKIKNYIGFFDEENYVFIDIEEGREDKLTPFIASYHLEEEIYRNHNKYKFELRKGDDNIYTLNTTLLPPNIEEEREKKQWEASDCLSKKYINYINDDEVIIDQINIAYVNQIMKYVKEPFTPINVYIGHDKQITITKDDWNEFVKLNQEYEKKVKEVYNNHIENIKALDSVEDILNYNADADYPPTLRYSTHKNFEEKKQYGIYILTYYGRMPELDTHYVQNTPVIFSGKLRDNLKKRIEADKANGLAETKLWYNGEFLKIDITVAEQLLDKINKQANDNFDILQEKIKQLNSAQTDEEIENVMAHKQDGYLPALHITLNIDELK